jgi:hypothetical protein
MKAQRTRTIALVLLIVAPAFLLAGGTAYWAEKLERAAAQELLQHNAVQLAAGVDAELERTVSVLQALALSSELQRGDLRAFHELAARMVNADPHWQNVQLISPMGEHLTNSRLPFGVPLPPLNRPDLPMSAAVSRQPVVSDVEMAVVAQRMLTVVYVPVIQNETVAYVVAAAIEPPNWQGVLRSRLPPAVHAALLDRYSFVITNTYEADLARHAADDTRHALPPSAPGELTGDFKRMGVLGGKRLFTANQKAGFSGWTVVTFMPLEEAGFFHRHGWLLFAAGSLLLLAWGLAIGLTFARGRSTTAPPVDGA